MLSQKSAIFFALERLRAHARGGFSFFFYFLSFLFMLLFLFFVFFFSFFHGFHMVWGLNSSALLENMRFNGFFWG